MVGEHHRRSAGARRPAPGTGVRTPARSRRHVWFAGLLGGMIALAVWGKLRFVSDVPRMAYADPDQRQSDPAEDDAPGGVEPREAR
ncbi:MAG: hypothetical protein AAFO89_10830 [Planctomycetota bacterium]